MRTIDLILYIIAGVCFALAASNRVTQVNLVAAGLLAWVLVPLLAVARH